ncbi:MAG: glycoside hydrolase family 13 protein [Jiangellaceae bacterium]|nr:glycoside hydrolase family 13 protein [Jiangellaceae bacterium]
MTPAADQWWRSAVIYQVYIRSFADGTGDGVGDIAGIRSRLPYLQELGVDALWITPWYPSPMNDGGYDVADYRDIAPEFGTLALADALIREAHERRLRVLIDIVANHTSHRHRWFAQALAALPGSPERDRYIFRPGRGPDGNEPPNNWLSLFGGPGWTRVTERDGSLGEWYLHLFDVTQPDLNWQNSEVRAEFLDILRFWFDRGIDGFRIDVAHGLAKDPALPDLDYIRTSPYPIHAPYPRGNHPFDDRDEVHEIYREWRAVADSYVPPRAFVAEAWVDSAERLARYVWPGQLHSAFNFDYLRSPWNASELRKTIDVSLDVLNPAGAATTWVLSNHDVERHVTRYGREVTAIPSVRERPAAPGPSDIALGTRRARAAALLMLALPGSAYVYQGEELGLPEVLDLPESALRDPIWKRSGHRVRGRDGCRVPLPWTRRGPSHGFGVNGSWLPQPPYWSDYAVQGQREDPRSMLSLYREALRLRRDLPALGDGSLRWLTDGGPDVLAFAREPEFACAVNLGETFVALPEHSRVLLSSVPLVDNTLPPDAAAWLAT